LAGKHPRTGERHRAPSFSATGDIGIGHLPEELTAYGAAAEADSDLQSSHNILDARAIRAALERNAFNRLAAAKELGIHKTTLFRRMKKLGISLPEQDGRTRRAGNIARPTLSCLRNYGNLAPRLPSSLIKITVNCVIR
jgi:hypothetical protein